MTNESSSEPEDLTPVELLTALTDLLAKPKPKDHDWQEESGRLAARLAVKFASEADDGMALRQVAAITLAAKCGVKQAGKITLKLGRWQARPPPFIFSLDTHVQQSAALDALAKLSMPWAPRYALDHLKDPQLKVENVSILLQWMRKAAPSWLQFITDASIALGESRAHSLELSLAVAKHAEKWMWPGDRNRAILIEGVSLWCHALAQCAAATKQSQKFGPAFLAHAYATLELAVRTTPPILFQPPFVQIYGDIHAVGIQLKKKPPNSVDQACQVAIQLVGDAIDRHGLHAVVQFRPLMSILRIAFQDFDKALSLAIQQTPALKQLLEPEPETDEYESTDSNYAVEAAFAELFPAWIAHQSRLSNPAEVDMLNEMLLKAADSVGVTLVGVAGELAAYDSLTHDLLRPLEGAAQVRIVRPGVQAARSDGRRRLLVNVLVDRIDSSLPMAD